MENWIESEEKRQLTALLEILVGGLVCLFSVFVAFLIGFILTSDWVLAFLGICLLIASGVVAHRLHLLFMELSGKHYYRLGQLDRLIIMHEKKLNAGWKQFKDKEPENGQRVWLHTEKIFAPNVEYNTHWGKEWYYPEGKYDAKPEDYWMPFCYPEPPKTSS